MRCMKNVCGKYRENSKYVCEKYYAMLGKLESNFNDRLKKVEENLRNSPK